MSAYGWKATIGFIGPPRTNETVLHEAFQLVRPGISWCWSTMGLPEFGKYEFDQALGTVSLCARELAARKVKVIVIAGVPLLTSRDPGYHLELQRQTQSEVGDDILVTSDLACFIGAAKALGLKRLALCSLYQRYIQDNFKTHLAAQGLKTVSDVCLDYKLADCMTKSTLDSSFDAASQIFELNADVDGMILACPQWPVIHNVPKLEEKFGKPVIGHIGAVMWGALAQIGVDARQTGFGRLLAEWPTWPSEA